MYSVTTKNNLHTYVKFSQLKVVYILWISTIIRWLIFIKIQKKYKKTTKFTFLFVNSFYSITTKYIIELNFLCLPKKYEINQKIRFRTYQQINENKNKKVQNFFATFISISYLFCIQKFSFFSLFSFFPHISKLSTQLKTQLQSVSFYTYFIFLFCCFMYKYMRKRNI